MIKKLVLGLALALAAVAMAVAPALAYVGTPGASCGTSGTTIAAGGSVTFTAHFNGGVGQTVTFSATGGNAGTSVTFSPPTALTDASGNVTTTATFSNGSSGNVTLTGTVTGGAQFCSATAAVSAYPAASYLPLGIPAPVVWIAVLLVGLALVSTAVFGKRRQQPSI